MTNWKHWLVAGSIALVGVLLHLGALDNEALFHDPYVVMENPVTLEPFSLSAHLGSGFWGPYRPEVDAWRPLATMTLAWNRLVHGLDPWGYRLVNLLLHGSATLLVFLLALQFQLGLGAAALVGLIFAVHPVHVETIVTYEGRAELLMTVCVLLGWWLFERQRYISSAVCIALALLSHELALMGAVWILWRHWTERLNAQPTLDDRHWWWTAPVALIIAWMVARSAALGHLVGASPDFIDNPLASLSFLDRIIPSMALHLHAFKLVFAPFALAADLSYAAFIPGDISWAQAIIGAVLLIAAIGAVLYASRVHSVLSCCAALWVGSYLLVSHLGPSLPNVFCERNLYLPSIGVLLAVGFVFKNLLTHRRLRAGTWITTGIVVALFAMRTVVRVEDWSTGQTFYQTLLRDAPGNLKALTNLARLEFAQGNTEAALEFAQEAVAVGESTWLANLAAAQVHIGLHHGKEAADYLAAAEELAPGRAGVVSARCAHSARFGQPAAVAHCQRAVETGSDLLNDTIHLAVAHSNAQNHAEAEQTFRRAASIEGASGVRALHGHAIFLARKGDLPQARALLLKGLSQQPRSKMLLETLNLVVQKLSSAPGDPR